MEARGLHESGGFQGSSKQSGVVGEASGTPSPEASSLHNSIKYLSNDGTAKI